MSRIYPITSMLLTTALLIIAPVQAQQTTLPAAQRGPDESSPETSKQVVPTIPKQTPKQASEQALKPPSSKQSSKQTLKEEAPPEPKKVTERAPNSSTLEAVKKQFVQRFPEASEVQIRTTPYGLFEVQIGMNLFYTDANVTWVMQGRLIDAVTRRDLTQARLEALSAISFDQLPLNLAIKQVHGNGKRGVAIFEDPNCHYCKQLHHLLATQPDLTVYIFPYPILGPDSSEKARNVWCATDPAVTWDDWMLHNNVPPARSCSAPLDQLLALGRKLMVQGVPTLFFTDGRRISGDLTQETLSSYLAQSTLQN